MFKYEKDLERRYVKMESRVNFEYRRIDMVNQFGIKESFNVLDYGTHLSFSTVFGVDGGLCITKPVIYTAEGFKPLASILKEGNGTPEEQIKSYLKSRRGTYSLGFVMTNNGNQAVLQSVTSLICVMKGKVSKETGAYIDKPICELYSPFNLTEEHIVAQRVTSFNKSGKGKDVFLLNQVKKRLLTAVAPYVSSREKFLANRL